MASLSQYASRFLSSGLASSVRPGVDDDNGASDPSDPLFYSQASVSGAPFSHPYGPDYSISSSDGLPTPPAGSRHAAQSGILHSLTGASRFGPASFMPAGKARNTVGVRDSMIREMDDEEDVDLWRDDRRMPAIASRIAESTISDNTSDSMDSIQHASDRLNQQQVTAAANAAKAGAAQDPFLADDDLDADDSKSFYGNKESHADRSSPSSIYAQTRQSRAGGSHQPMTSPHFSAAKARGWLAHGSTTISSSRISPNIKGKGRSNHRNDDIYAQHEPGDSTLARSGMGASSTNRSSLLHSQRVKSSRASRTRTEGLYSIYDEREQQDADDRSVTSRSRSSSISASSVTDSESDSDHNRPSRRHHASSKINRSSQAGRNRARDMTSTLRDPLLPSASVGRHSRSIGGRDSSSDTENEGSDVQFQSRRPQRGPKHENDVLNDVFVYPSPPARSGWGPWANRLAFGKYRDKTAIAIFAAVVGTTILIGLYTSWDVRAPSAPATPKTRPSSYYTITRSLPVLILLTFVSFGAGVANLLFLRNLTQLGGARVLRTGLMGVPIVLGLGWTWAFAGSFIYDDEPWSGGAWTTTGLRLVSIIPLALAAIFTRMVWARRKALSRSIAVLELSCTVVLEHPALLVLAAASLVVFILVTIPFVYIFTRLFLVGHFGRPVGDSMEWRTDTKAALLAWATLLAWLWTWAVLRGIQRVTVAGVVSHWYFNRISNDPDGNPVSADAETGAGHAAAPSNEPHEVLVDKRRADEDDRTDDIYGEDDDSIYGDSTPSAPGAFRQSNHARRPVRHAATPDPTEVVRASFSRATGPALGSVCLAALILAFIRTLTVMAELARRISNATTKRHVPRLLQPLTHVVVMLAGLGAVLKGYSDLALVYVGVTGDGFGTAARKSAQLITRRGVKGVMDGLIINLVLDLTAIALSFLAGLAGFLFSAHQLHVPADAPLVGLLCAILPYWTLRLCADVLSNAADTLYLCYAIDHASNDEHCPKAASAFTATNNAQDGSESMLPF